MRRDVPVTRFFQVTLLLKKLIWCSQLTFLTKNGDGGDPSTFLIPTNKRSKECF